MRLTPDLIPSKIDTGPCLYLGRGLWMMETRFVNIQPTYTHTIGHTSF